MQLVDKNVLITGGRRIGGQLAVMLAQRGANVAMSWHTKEEPVKAWLEEAGRVGARTLAVQADLRQAADVDRLVEAVVSELGSIDVLINLASIYNKTPFNELTPADYDSMMDSNLRGPYLTAVAVAKQMLRQPADNGIQGKIIHFTDWALDRPYRDFLPYLVAKGGLVTLTKALAVELAPSILVNAIAPGTMEPPPNLSKEKLAEILELSALRRCGSAGDVNNAVLYLLEGTDFVTGEVYRVDGGRFLGPTGQAQGDWD
jgi:pteridine reductase